MVSKFVRIPGMTRSVPEWMVHLYFRDHHTKFVKEREMRELEKETIMAAMIKFEPGYFVSFHDIHQVLSNAGIDENTLRRRLRELAHEGHIIEVLRVRGWFKRYIYSMTEGKV